MAVKTRVPNPNGEAAAKQILDRWKGDHFADACTAATEIGMIHSGCWMTDGRAREIIRTEFNRRKINDLHWSTVHAAFINGRDSVITTAQLKARYFPAPVADNDNEPADSPTSRDSLSALTDPGGVVSELVDWIVSSASRPSRELALSAVIPFVGALLGRRFASHSDLRTNFYVVALADSGYGKDHARSQLKRLITAAGLDRISGPNRFMTVDRKWLVFTQFKYRKRKAIHIEIPMRPELEELIEATPIGDTTFLLNAWARPFREHAFSVFFRGACDEAGLPHCTSHGLRKAAAARLAELGASEKEIMAITGHTTSKEIKRYTDAADKRILAV